MADGILADGAETDGAAPAACTEFQEFSRHAEALAAIAERALASGAARQIASEDIARVLTAAVKLYAARTETEAMPPPVSAERVTPTEVVVAVSEMMRAANLNLFDLSMWYRRARRESGDPI